MASLRECQRRWGRSDDASAYADFPTEWPHDEEACLACEDMRWANGRHWVRTRSGTRYFDGDWRGEEAHEIALAYPNRVRALIEHRHQVSLSRRRATGPSAESAPVPASRPPVAPSEPAPATPRRVTMDDGHDALRCQRCLAYAIWVWPFAERMSRGTRNAEAEWLKGASDGYVIGPWRPGTWLAENVFPDRGDLEHVVTMRPKGMAPWEWVEAMEISGSPTPWDDLPREVGFWRDPEARAREREAWVRANGWDPMASSSGWQAGDEPEA